MCRPLKRQRNTPPVTWVLSYIHGPSITWKVCFSVHAHVCVFMCVCECFFISFHLLIALITDLLSASHSVRRKNKLLGHMKRSHTHIHTLVTHTYPSSSQPVGSLILCLPVICLSLSPLPDPLFPSLALLEQNISLPVSVSVYFASAVGGRPNLQPGIHLNVLLLPSNYVTIKGLRNNAIPSTKKFYILG